MNKPKIWKSIICSPLMLLLFIVTYVVVYLIFSLLVYLLSIIPVIDSLISMLFEARGDSPDIVAPLISATVAYLLSNFVLELLHRNDNSKTFTLTRRICGTILVVIWSIALIANIVLSAGFIKIYTCIVLIIAGLLHFPSK